MASYIHLKWFVVLFPHYLSWHVGGGGGGRRIRVVIMETNEETTTVDLVTDYEDIISSFSSSGDISDFSSPLDWEWLNDRNTTTIEDVADGGAMEALCDMPSPSSTGMSITSISDSPSPIMSTSMATNTNAIQHFHGELLLPIYDTLSHSMTTKDVVQIIGSGVPDNRTAKLVPSQPKDNLSFMIATSYLEDWKDVLSDDLGVWSPNGTKTLFYARTFRADGGMSVEHMTSAGEADLAAYRYLYNYPSERSFKRVIVKVMSKTDDGWLIMPHILLQYYFDNGKKEIMVSPHGNSRREIPFIRTKESTKRKIKSASTEGKTKCKSIFTNLVREKGGLMQVNV